MERFEIDPDALAVLHETEAGEVEEPPEQISTPNAEAALDDLLDEFVEVVNARDWSGLEELLAPEAEAAFLEERSRRGVVEGLSDLSLRFPSLVLTRGDLGPEPIVAAWTYDPDAERYDGVGYFTFEIGEGPEPLIERLEYVDDFWDVAELVVEEPDRSELPEWDDWSELDES